MSPYVAPLSLTVFRLLLGPVMLGVAWFQPSSGPWLATCLLPAILSDLFDGILARRNGVATPALRRFDSQTDLVFWLCVLGCIAVLHGTALDWAWLAAVLGLEACLYMVCFVRFGREPCTHAMSARVWSVILVACLGWVLATGDGRYALPILFATYFVVWLDVLLILLLLPDWRNDVPSFRHALRYRREARDV